jgi:hypothetical protein
MRRTISGAARAAALCLALPLARAPIARAQQITVGPNVRVSAARPDDAHNEVLVAADPHDPARLLACSIVIYGTENQIRTAVYASRDGGRSWAPTLYTGPYATLSADPSVAFGPGGEAYYSVIFCEEGDRPCRLSLFRSRDGGLTWSGPEAGAGSSGVDRPYVTVDDTGGRYQGRVYVNAQASVPGTGGEPRPRELTVYRSTDGGATLGLSAKRQAPDTRSILFPGNGAVLSDGTYLFAYTELHSPEEGRAPEDTTQNPPRRPNGTVKIISSADGGDSLSPAVTVSEAYGAWPANDVSLFPYLAVDRSGGPFKDRLYVAWPDVRSGRCEILFSYSADRGRSWTRPKTVDDAAPFGAGRRGPDDFLPAVAVNGRGVVGVSWYDRRESPDGLGWRVRFAASLDGGDTFSPSVPVAEEPMDQEKGRWGVGGRTLPSGRAAGEPLNFALWLDTFNFSGGHTAGLAADAAGVFHPLWVDNRTGVRQVWTAAVTVAGEAVPNGSPELAALDDLSDRAVVEIFSPALDRASGLLTADVRLKNTSGSTIKGPLKLRVLTLRSTAANSAAVVGADNGLTGAGAIWDFTTLIPAAGLGPGNFSGPKRLTFRLSGLLPAADQLRHSKTSFAAIDVRVLGHANSGGVVKH